MSVNDRKRGARVREGYWFVPKLFGFGATPVTWQGWVLTLGFVAALLLDIRWLRPELPKAIVAAALLAAFVTIAWRKTDGGWHWHWGVRR